MANTRTKYVTERKREREKVFQTLKPNTLRLLLMMLMLMMMMLLLLLLLLLLFAIERFYYETRVDFNHSTTLFKLAELLSDMASSVS